MPLSPIIGSIGSVMIRSGVLAATSSISIPPSVLAIIETALGFPIDHYPEVKLARNFAGLFDIHPAHDSSLGTGLMGYERLAEQLRWRTRGPRWRSIRL